MIRKAAAMPRKAEGPPTTWMEWACIIGAAAILLIALGLFVSDALSHLLAMVVG